MIAKEGELPKLFERKIFGRAKEGLFITVAFVIFFLNILPLDRIAMLGSAVFLIIYGSVNAAHLKLLKKTRANLYLIWLAIAADALSLLVLLVYSYRTSKIVLLVLIAVAVLSFIVEWVYRSISNRDLKIR